MIPVFRKTVILGAVAALALSACSTENDVTATNSTALATDPTTSRAVQQTSTVRQTTSTTASIDATVIIDDFSFSVPTIASVGTPITIENQDSASHTWTSVDDVFNSGGLAPGDTFEFTFEEPGEYAFFCSFHPTQMTGRITVDP